MATPQEQFAFLDEPAETFDLIKLDLAAKLKEMLLVQAMQIQVKNMDNKAVAINFLKSWVEQNIVPMIRGFDTVVQKEAIKTTANFIKTFGLG